jgi:cytochrome o ubiquinol oxidase subunit 2
MKRKHRPLLFLLPVIGLVLVGAALVWGTNVAVLNPKGSIARDQFELIIFTSLLSLVVVIPVFLLTFYISWKYRASKKATYQPEWDRNRLIEAIWWLIPLILITILAVITWVTTHKLDPFKPLESDKKPLTVQVVALEWKWLFIYPEQNIASVNEVAFPVDTPVNFRITSDAPMNSFWIPQLGGQIYAMAGMQTKLHLMADTVGVYNGASANLSGGGFADMKFKARALTSGDFNAWVKQVKASQQELTMSAYESLAAASKNNPVRYYSSRDERLYDTVIMKYMTPGMHEDNDEHQEGH